MKKWDNGVVSLNITSCMSCPEKKQIMAKRKVSGQWVQEGSSESATTEGVADDDINDDK